MTEKERELYEEGKQCLHCRYYRKLPIEELKYDFGYCTNLDSPKWYQVLFEHCTCEKWEGKTDEQLEQEEREIEEILGKESHDSE